MGSIASSSEQFSFFNSIIQSNISVKTHWWQTWLKKKFVWIQSYEAISYTKLLLLQMAPTYLRATLS